MVSRLEEPTMRHVPLCLVVPFVLACDLVGPSTTIQVEGTFTAAYDGSPIAGGQVLVSDPVE